MMKNLILVVALAACGNTSSTPIANAGSGAGDDSVSAPKDTRTEIEKRRDTACGTLGPKITACAVEDAKKALAAGSIKQNDFDASTAPEIQKKNTAEFIEACEKQPYSSRQVRVLEVCQVQETECEPMLACLDNLDKE